MESVAPISNSRRRVPHWGICLAGGCLVLISLVVILVVWPAWRVQKLMDAIAAKNDTNARWMVLEVSRPDWVPEWFEERLWYIPMVDRAESFYNGSYRLSDDDLAVVCTMTELKSLNISYHRCSTEGMRRIAGVSGLRSLFIPIDAPASDEFLYDLGEHVRLTELTLTGSGVTDETLSKLSSFNSLLSLYLASTRVTGSRFQDLAKLPKLESLWVEDSPIDDAGLNLLSSVRGLKDVDLNKTKITLAGINGLRALPCLKVLSIRGKRLPEIPPSALAGFRSLEFLDLSQPYGGPSNGVTDDEMAAFTGHPSLRIVNLSGTPVTDATLRVLATLPRLEYLSLSVTEITDEGLKTLAGIKSLKGIVWPPIHGSWPRCSKQAIQDLFDARPDLQRIERLPSRDDL